MNRAISPRENERRRAAKERKRQIDEGNLTSIKQKLEQGIVQSEEKRKQTCEERRQKLRKHFAKVEEICREQAQRRKSSVEKMRTELERKLDQATHKREETLEQVKHVAHHSSEKKP